MSYKDLVFLQHILDSIGDLVGSTSKMTKEKFQKSKDTKDACIRRIEVIGEAAKNLSQEIKEKYPAIEWKKIVGARDRMIHSYFDVDMDIVWDIIKKDIPVLKKQIENIKGELALKTEGG